MADARQPGDDDNVVEAAVDPTVKHIEDLRKAADDDSAFAKSQADFAAVEHDHAVQLRAEHRDAEADEINRDALQQMDAAKRTMQHSTEEAAEADVLETQQKHKWAGELRAMPNQSLDTLRTAVSRVRTFVEEMSPGDLLAVGLAAQMNGQQLSALRQQITTTGLALEEALVSPQSVRANAGRIVEDLVAFVAAVMTIADHLPPLFELMRHFGQLLMQFHI